MTMCMMSSSGSGTMMATMISVFSSMFAFQLTAAALQAVLWQRWLRSARWWWVIVCQMGLLIATALTTGWFFMMTVVFNLDVLQNQMHSMGVMSSGIVIFLGVMVAAQWLFLRKRLYLATLWAMLNPLAIALLWFSMVLLSPIREFPDSLNFISVGIEMVSGVVAGLLTGYGIKAVCDRHDARTAIR